MSFHRACCCAPCYSLTHCDTEAVTYTKTDLSAYVGDVVAIGGECYTVGEPETCPSPADVTVTDDYETCEACETAQNPCPCDAGVMKQCGSCTDCTPDEIRVVFSGVSECSCFAFGSSGYLVTLNTALNGAHTLAQSGGDNCVWTLTVSGGVHEEIYTATDCAGTADDSADTDYTITLERTGAGWELQVGYSAALAGGEAPVLFVGSVAESADGDCIEIDAISNDLDGTGGNDCGDSPAAGLVVATDGTATFTICP